MTRLAGAVALAGVLILPLAACHRAPEAEAPQALPSVSEHTVVFPDKQDPATLRIAPVAAPEARPVDLPGRLAWDEDRTTRVYAPYAGRVEQLLAAVGQEVKRGQPLARLTSADIGQAQADWHKAEADLAVAQRAAARSRELAEAGVIARKDLEQAEGDLARASAEGARAKGRLAQYGVAPGAVTMGFALNAPLAGTVVERNLNAGAEVRTDVQGAPLFVISDPRALWAQIDVDETLLSLVQVGQKLSLSTAAWPDKRFDATVIGVGASVDPASRTVKLRARVDNPERLLKSEMFVSARLMRPAGLPILPADAVFLRGTEQFVMVAKGQGRFERRAVQVRQAGGNDWAVQQGVAVGERVVVGGALFLNQILDATK